MKHAFSLEFITLLAVLVGSFGASRAGAQEPGEVREEAAASIGPDVEPEHPPHDEPVVRTEPWPDEVIELASTIAVQQEGRIKPLSTFASFFMLQINGRRSHEIKPVVDGEETIELRPVEWLLDCMFFPEQARSYEVFLVEDYDVLDLIGLDVDRDRKKKRDRYSYEFLFAGGMRLEELANQYDSIDEKARSPLQGHVMRLAANFFRFHALFMYWDGLNVFPPPAGAREWMSTMSLAERARSESGALDAQLEQRDRLAELLDKREDLGAFAAAFQPFHSGLKELAQARGEYDKIELEYSYYKSDFFFRAQWLFVVGFLFTVLVWMRPKSRWLGTFARYWLLVPLGLLTAGIWVRCVLRERPPVSTLYETILFITAIAVAAALIVEWINKRRVAQCLAALLGSIGLFFAAWYEETSAVDTMPQLQAVLDTNFWLSTHVTTITMGYAAGLLAAAIAHVYLLGKLFGIRRGDKPFYREIARMVYGAIAFGLVFSTIGTILGGVWANDSWGRFWGWDPKENGALLIVLANLVILHGRLGGYLREFGVCLASILLATVVAFSWFHTNLLGVGLHSYGFDKTLHTLVWGIYWTEWTVFGLGVFAWAAERRRAIVPSPAAAQAGPEPTYN